MSDVKIPGQIKEKLIQRKQELRATDVCSRATKRSRIARRAFRRVSAWSPSGRSSISACNPIFRWTSGA